MAKRVVALVAGAVAVLLAVGGCSTEPTPNPTIGVPPTPAQPDTAEQTPAGDPGTVDSGVGPTSPRGARPWEVGERMQLWGPPMSAGIGQYVTVTAIKPLDSSCPAAVTKENAKPEHGRFLTIEMTVVSALTKFPRLSRLSLT
ncbi:MAG: hypothetical protein EKK42_27230 [Pseudonocardiaceae bacterium]|nr:MAG: hypothetical protein EKK42_27230 [Pseudonocardiaceae bacterium]